MTDYMAVDTDLPPYFPYPQFLMDMPLSHTAALAYALLLDRAHLSQLNGWIDEAGRVYLIFPVEKIAAALKEISDALGRETIDSYNTSENRGSQTSHGLNYQKLGKDVP